MNRLLPTLHEGHAPIYLHVAFSEALEAYENWPRVENEPTVEFEDRSVPISSIFGRIRNCTDPLPARIFDAAATIMGSHVTFADKEHATYADAARIMRVLCVTRLRGGAFMERST